MNTKQSYLLTGGNGQQLLQALRRALRHATDIEIAVSFIKYSGLELIFKDICHGNGLERKTIKKIVHIPAGVDNGTQIRLAGEGQPGLNGGPHGNLYIEIRVKSHQFFKRRQDDILLDLNINLAQATLGSEIEVPTMDGKEKLIIPPGTQPGRIFKLKNHGVPRLRSSGRGEQLIIIGVTIPTHITDEQRDLFEKLANTLGTEVLPQEKGFFEKLKEVLSG